MEIKSRLPTSLIHRFAEACRELATSTVLLHAAVAEQLGINPSDHQCAHLVRREGPMTAGQLAERCGLTTGAMTGVVDRLEAAGFAERTPDPTDRRKVLVRYKTGSEAAVSALLAGYTSTMAKLCNRYSRDDLRLIMKFFELAAAVSGEEARKLHSANPKNVREVPPRQRTDSR